MLFSAAALGFFLPEIHGAEIPADAVEITDAEHADLMAGQAAGQIIAAGPDGRPILIDPPPAAPAAPKLAPTPAQLRAALAALGLQDDQIDGIFAAAASISA